MMMMMMMLLLLMMNFRDDKVLLLACRQEVGLVLNRYKDFFLAVSTVGRVVAGLLPGYGDSKH
jgi:hypothetical protein